MTFEPIRHFLRERGWQKYHDNVTSDSIEYWCKRYKDARRCECNYDKDGIQVVVWLHEVPFSQVVHRSVDVEVTGEYDGQWYKLQCCSITPSEFLQAHETIIARLLRAWEGLSQ